MKLMILWLCLFSLPQPAHALEIEAPVIFPEYQQRMPENTDSLLDGLLELFNNAVDNLSPDLREASQISMSLMAVVLLVSILQAVSAPISHAAEIAGAVSVAVILLNSANAMIRLAAGTVQEISNYGKLLLPVMTTALSAQGGITSSGAIYAGTAFFTAFLQSIMSSFLIPGIYLYLGLITGNAATGEEILKRTGDLIKQIMSWCLKTLLIVFTTYLSLTHVVSGTTDAAALKAAKVTMSSFIPVVGGILSDASEAVLVSAGLLKNSAGIYGILVVLALFLHPFLQIGIHYLILRFTAAVCSIFGTKQLTGIIDCFSTAMGLLLGITGASCVMMLISTVCYMKGVS